MRKIITNSILALVVSLILSGSISNAQNCKFIVGKVMKQQSNNKLSDADSVNIIIINDNNDTIAGTNTISNQQGYYIINANNMTNGNYKIVANKNNCGTESERFYTLDELLNDSNKTLILHQDVIVNVNNDTVICNGQNVQLSATGGDSYLWTPATGLSYDSISNPLATPSQTTTYTVTVKKNGCFATKNVVVGVYKVSASSDITLCGTSTTNIIATISPSIQNVVYSWNNGGNTDTITVSPTATTSYIVTATTSNGCSGTAQTVVTNNNVPVSVSVTQTSYEQRCGGADVTLLATPVNGGSTPSYQWVKNGVNVGSDTCSYMDFVTSGTTLYCIVTSSSNAECIINNPAESNHINYPIFILCKTTEDISGIKTNDNSSNTVKVNVYPNPNTDGKCTVDVTTKVNSGIKISMFNSLGVKVYEKTIRENTNKQQVEMNIKNMTSGIYMILVETNGITKKVEVIKE